MCSPDSTLVWGLRRAKTRRTYKMAWYALTPRYRRRLAKGFEDVLQLLVADVVVNLCHGEVGMFALPVLYSRVSRSV